MLGLRGSRLGPDDVGEMQKQRRACRVCVLEHGLCQAQEPQFVVSRAPVNKRCDGGSQEWRVVMLGWNV